MKFSKYNLFIPVNNDQYLLFNSLTGSTFLIDEKFKKTIENNDIENLPEDVKKEYLDKKILLDDSVDEIRYFEYFHNKMKYDSKVLSLTILLTWACNLKCIYCYEGAGEIKNATLTSETAENIIKFIKKQAENRSSKYISINLFGGEPLVNFKVGKQILIEIEKFCKETNRQLYTSIITNGTLINEEIIADLIRFNCKTVQITLDGPREVHDSRRMYKNDEGSYDTIIKNLKLICSTEGMAKPVIRINVDKTNLKDAYVLLDQLKEDGLTDCRVDFGIVRGGTDACAAYSSNCFAETELGDILDDLWKYAMKVGFKFNVRPMRKWMFCGLYGDYAYSIAPTGDVYKCWEIVGDEEHKIGSLNAEGDIENLQFCFYDWMGRNPLMIEDCKKCNYLPACGGGCGAISHNISGSYHAKGCFKTVGVVEKQVKLYFEQEYPELFK